MSENLLFMFSFRNFMALGLILKSLIHFEFMLVHGIKRWSGLIVLHVTVHEKKNLAV